MSDLKSTESIESRDFKSIGMAWEEAEQATVDREDWRGRVAQCVFERG